jgi:glycosyltransferase involved in cell wall biosynthesis
MTHPSLLTVTQASRLPFFVACATNTAAQTFRDIGEWVIVDGSPGATRANSEAFFDILKSVCEKSGIRIPLVFLRAENKTTIGGLRNLANERAKGTVLIWVDDDDYYGPHYVQHVLDILSTSEHDLAGCTRPYYYDLAWKCTFQYAGGQANLCTNNCLAYKRGYLKNHKYDETVNFGEEFGFLDGLSQTIAQLDPVKSQFVGLAHPWNMCSKGLIHLCAHYGLHETLEHRPRATVLPTKALNAYEAILGRLEPCPYDIVYYTGGFCGDEWDPRRQDLGGSEQAVVELSKEWTLKGRRVAVYGFFPFVEKTIDGVQYVHSAALHLHQTFDVLILWRIYGAWPVLNSDKKVSANVILLDLHDPIEAGNRSFHETLTRFRGRYPEARYMFKSKTHERGYSRLLSDAAVRSVIPNGVRNVFREADSKTPRIPFRFCYCSAYERGLVSILTNVWPHIVKEEPIAELHVYYGCRDEDVMRSVREATEATSNVMHHGRRGVREIVHEKRLSTFHLYPTNVPAETDCISLKESCAIGCIPVAVCRGLFSERDAFFVDGDPDTAEGGMAIARQILDLARDASEIEKVRERLQTSDTICSWSDVARTWIKTIDRGVS